ncbi:hypothetical protein ACPF3U_003545, partial [Vibrio cholerae]
ISEVAYLISYVFGLAFVYKFYPGKIFNIDSDLASLVSIFIYISSFLLGLIIVSILDDPRLSIYISVLITTSYNFIVMKVIFRRFF